LIWKRRKLLSGRRRVLDAAKNGIFTLSTLLERIKGFSKRKEGKLRDSLKDGVSIYPGGITR